MPPPALRCAAHNKLVCIGGVKLAGLDSALQTACIADVMANIRKIETKDIRTFGEYCEQFLDYISALVVGQPGLI